MKIPLSRWHFRIRSHKKIIIGEMGSSHSPMGRPDHTTAGQWAQNGKNGFKGHLATGNYLFADEHVKAMKPINTTKPLNTWDAVFEQDNSSNSV